MKKALIASLLGIALNVTSSHGQGYIIMENYKVVGGNTPVFSAVSYGSHTGAKAGQFVGAAQGWKADLLFSLNGGISYSLATGSQTPFFPGSADGGSPTTDGAGVFIGPTVTIPGYTSGSVVFKVEVFNGTSFAAPNTTLTGVSAAFTINSLQTNPLLPPDDILQLNGGTTPTGLQSFFVDAIPEPTVFALAGIGAAALMIVRRKK
jgi:hypothetical protein